ncbi:hypothetical protein BSL78_14288 [Apostichopus japonicus]|uniref:Transmembrane protein n=1 Tax=Stichopus japonicus TaxID=307972 RepID=A0A2G8KLG5_STIJA|nr:hypothetical protein BSL78_14288 [Apostichopus japonicus]
MEAIHYIATGIGLLFVYIGIMILTPINPPVGLSNEIMKEKFERLATVFPLEISPTMYRCFDGVFDLTAGSLAAFGRYHFRVLGIMEILFLLVFGIYSDMLLGESFLPSIPLAIACIVVLWLRDGLKAEADKEPSAKNKRH